MNDGNGMSYVILYGNILYFSDTKSGILVWDVWQQPTKEARMGKPSQNLVKKLSRT